MFTGIIKELGTVRKLARSGGVYCLEVESKNLPKTAAIGDSIAVNGVCLTATGISRTSVFFDVMEETVSRSNLSALKEGGRVNMEDSLRAGSPMGGHFVQGHVDCVAEITDIKERAGNFFIEIKFPPSEEFSGLIVEKGSVSVDGISLTVGEVMESSFKVYIIPHTLKATTLGLKKRRDMVNLEFDIIGKYIVRFAAGSKSKGTLTEEFLKTKGF